MTSAPNHQQPLSGSSPFIWIFILILFTGCAIFGPATSKKDAKSNDSSTEEIIEKRSGVVDTIKWTYTPEEDVAPIESRAKEIKSEIKSSYNVVLVAPFAARNFQGASDRFNSRMIRMVEFYAGLKFAWQNYNDGLQINLSVVDSQKDPEFKENFRNNESILNADIIIGPYFSDELEKMADFAKESGKVILSPWNTGIVTDNNPYYIQLRPSLKTHAEALTKYVRSHHQREEVLLICKDDDRDSVTLTYFQHANEKYARGDTFTPFEELKIDDISDPDLSEKLLLMIEEEGLRTFIIPNWSDQPFVIAALAKINFAKADKDVTVFGLPQWMTMSKMDYNYYENLNVHVSSATPLKFDSEAAKSLKQSFFTKYGVLPGEEAYYGLDVMRLVSNLLKESGTLVTKGLGKANVGSSYEFDFISVFGEDGESISHHENRHVQIVKFENFRFVHTD